MDFSKHYIVIPRKFESWYKKERALPQRPLDVCSYNYLSEKIQFLWNLTRRSDPNLTQDQKLFQNKFFNNIMNSVHKNEKLQEIVSTANDNNKLAKRRILTK